MTPSPCPPPCRLYLYTPSSPHYPTPHLHIISRLYYTPRTHHQHRIPHYRTHTFSFGFGFKCL
jgi:hypothetical protein